MADIFKSTWFCNYNQGGYSFSHWISGGTYTDNLIKAKNLAKLYMQLLGGGVSMPYIRMSLEGLRGDSQVFTAGFISQNAQAAVPVAGALASSVGSLGIKTIMDSPPDYWNTSALLRLGNSPTQFGHQFMRLIPDDLTILPGGIASDQNWNQGLIAYLAALIADQWGIYCVNRSTGYQKPIASFTVQAAAPGPPPVPAGTLIKTSVLHGVASGSKFRISGFSGTPTGVNGTWTADATPDTTTIFVSAVQNFPTITQVKTPGQLWSLAKVFAPYVITQCQLVRETSRRAGRPFAVLVGRRKKTVKK